MPGKRDFGLGSGLIWRKLGRWLLDLNQLLPVKRLGILLVVIVGTLWWGVLLAVAAVSSCKVLGDRWVAPPSCCSDLI